MINRLMNTAFGAIIHQLIKGKVRNGSIQAVKGYIQAVKFARLALMGLFGVGAAAAILVAGIFLMITGIIGLLPIDPNTVAMIILAMGGVLTLISVIGFFLVFSQKRWLEMSKSYELMDAALAPWDGMLPPNPVEVMKGHISVPQAPTAEELRAARELEIGREHHRGGFSNAAFSPGR